MPFWAALPALASLGVGAYQASRGRGEMGGFPSLPPSGLPDVGESLQLAETMRGRGMDIFERPAEPTSQIAALQPLLDVELARIREQGQQAKGRAAGAAERRGLTFSDIALGQLGGIDVGTMQAERGARGDILSRALEERRFGEAQELDFLRSQIASAEAMALSREEADISRAGGMAQMGTARDFYNMRAREAEEADRMTMIQEMLGMMPYLAGQFGGGTPQPIESPYSGNPMLNLPYDRR